MPTRSYFTFSAWASNDFKLLVTFFNSSSRSPDLLSNVRKKRSKRKKCTDLKGRHAEEIEPWHCLKFHSNTVLLKDRKISFIYHKTNFFISYIWLWVGHRARQRQRRLVSSLEENPLKTVEQLELQPEETEQSVRGAGRWRLEEDGGLLSSTGGISFHSLNAFRIYFMLIYDWLRHVKWHAKGDVLPYQSATRIQDWQQVGPITVPKFHSHIYTTVNKKYFLILESVSKEI